MDSDTPLPMGTPSRSPAARPNRLPQALSLGATLAVVLLALTPLSCDTATEQPDCADDPCHPECATPGLDISAEPGSLTLDDGEQGTVTIGIIRTCIHGDADLSVVGSLPSGVTATINPDPAPGFEASLTLTNTGATPGTYNITVRGTLLFVDETTIMLIVPGPAGPCAPWVEVPAPGAGYWDVHFPNSNDGYIASTELLRSTDGGLSWSAVATAPIPNGGTFYHVFFPTVDVGYLVDDLAFYRTRDGGATWTTLTSYPGEGINDLYFLDENNGFVVPDFGAMVWHTTDGGDTWTARTRPGPAAHTGGITFVTPTQGALALGSFQTGAGGLAYTTDGGLTWHGATAPSGEYHWVSFSDPVNGVAGGNILVRTTDGGVTWVQRGDPAGPLYNGALRPGRAEGYAGGDHELYETTDGGGTWSLRCSARTFGVWVTNNGTGVAVGDRILRRD